MKTKYHRQRAGAKPQKASTHTEGWYGLFSGYIGTEGEATYEDGMIACELGVVVGRGHCDEVSRTYLVIIQPNCCFPCPP